MQIDWTTSALVVVDPQVDVLTPESVIWDLLGEQVAQVGVVDKLIMLRDQAEKSGVPVMYSWLRVTEADYASWNHRNGLQKLMAERRMMLPDQGSRFAPGLEPTPATILLSPRKGPSAVHSDMMVQLRQRGIETIVLAGMIANLCVESHVRDATDGGFNAIVVGDATATTDDGTLSAALASFGLLASAVVGTEDVLESLRALQVAEAI